MFHDILTLSDIKLPLNKILLNLALISDRRIFSQIYGSILWKRFRSIINVRVKSKLTTTLFVLKQVQSVLNPAPNSDLELELDHESFNLFSAHP